MRPVENKKADTLRERLVFQAVLLTFGGFFIWLNAAALFSREGAAAPSGDANDAAAYLARDTPLCTSTSRTATCVTIPAGSPVDIFERSGGQSRALLVWQRIVMPDGSSIQIDNLPATDTAGYAGLEDEVDFHTWRLIKGVVLSTLLGVGTELSLGGEESDLVRALRESTQQNANRAGQRITERNLNIQPTITVRPGWPLRVIVHRDLVLRPYRG